MRCCYSCVIYTIIFVFFSPYLFMYRLMSVLYLCNNDFWTRNQFGKCVASSSHISPNIKNKYGNQMGNNEKKKHFFRYYIIFFSYVCNTVSPMIFVPNQLVGAPSGTDVAIDCNTEAHPKYIKNPFLYKILFLFWHALFMIWYVVYFTGICSTYHATIHMSRCRLRSTCFSYVLLHRKKMSAWWVLC